MRDEKRFDRLGDCRWCAELKDICPACETAAEVRAEARFEETGRRY